jgi:O-antigen ligase
LFPADLLCIVLAFAVAARTIDGQLRGKVHWIWWLLGSIQLVDALRGAALYGSPAGVDYRASFYVWVGTVYIASFGYSEQLVGRVLRTFGRMAIIVCAVAVWRWILVAVDPGYRAQIQAIDPTDLAFLRVVPATPMIVLALATIGVVYLALKQQLPARWRLAPAGFGLVILLMQHRSVWLASAVGCGVLVLLLMRRREHKVRRMLLRFAGAALIVALVVFKSGISDSISSSIETQAAAALDTEQGTMVGRLLHWEQLLEEFQDSDSLSHVIGLPYGHSFGDQEDVDEDQIIEMSPHDEYLALLLHGGILGLACFVWFAQLGIRTGLRRAREGGDPHAPLLVAYAAALVVYYVPYEIQYAHILVWGLLLALLRAPDRQLDVRKG